MPLNSLFKMTPLSEISEAIKDGTHGTFRRVKAGVPFLSAKNVTENGLVEWGDNDDLVSKEDYIAITSSFKPRLNDLLLTIVGSLGRRALFKEAEVAFQRSVAFIRPNTSKVLPRFLFQSTGSNAFYRQLVQRSNATAQAGLYLGELAKTEIPIPEIEEQARIAYVLDTIDEAIAKTEAVIAKLKQVRTGMLHDLLSYGLDENGQLRDPITHPEQFKDSPLGRIPKKWEIRTLDSLGRWAGGKTPSKANPEFWTPPVSLWVTPKDVKDTAVASTEEKLSMIGSSIMEIFPAGSLLVVGRSGILRHTLPVAIATSPFTINQDLKVLVPNNQANEPTAQFLLLILLSRDEDILRRCVKVGTTVESIDWKDFKNLLVGWPSQSERFLIFKQIKTVDNQVLIFSEELKKLHSLKSGLQDDLLTGRVRVPANINLKEADR